MATAIFTVGIPHTTSLDISVEIPLEAPELLCTERTVEEMIIDASNEYGVHPLVPLNIAYCESGFDETAKNSSSTASGVFQFIRTTWNNHCFGDVYNAQDNVECAVKQIALGNIGFWSESYDCWRYLPYKQKTSR